MLSVFVFIKILNLSQQKYPDNALESKKEKRKAKKKCQYLNNITFKSIFKSDSSIAISRNKLKVFITPSEHTNTQLNICQKKISLFINS